jgi:hypothetical protein
MGPQLDEVTRMASVTKRTRTTPTATAIAHSLRFRRVSNRYPRRVAEAYAGDLARALADSDAQVAAMVAKWEQQHGVPVRDWIAIGRDEREEL